MAVRFRTPTSCNKSVMLSTARPPAYTPSSAHRITSKKPDSESILAPADRWSKKGSKLETHNIRIQFKSSRNARPLPGTSQTLAAAKRLGNLNYMDYPPHNVDPTCQLESHRNSENHRLRIVPHPSANPEQPQWRGRRCRRGPACRPTCCPPAAGQHR